MFDQRRALHAQRVKPCLLTGDLIGGKGNVVSNSGIFVSLLPACHVLSGRVGSFGALSNAHNGAAQNNEHCRGACSHAKNIRQRKQKGSSFSLSIAGMQRTRATPPGTMPSSRAALVACMTSSTRPFFHFGLGCSRVIIPPVRWVSGIAHVYFGKEYVEHRFYESAAFALSRLATPTV